MINFAMHTTIITLWKNGNNKSAIAKMTNHDWKTVNKAIKAYEAGEEIQIKKQVGSSLDAHKDKMETIQNHGQS